MKWKPFLLFFSLLLICISLFAQKEGNVWYFGENAGVDFNQVPPVALTDGEVDTREGCATVCNKSGQILFYTDGISVWNANHQIMPNGNGLLGDPSSTQSAIVVGWPTRDSLYFIFTIDADIGTFGLNYSIVNMNLLNGLGDVTSKNNFLYGPSCEKITAVIHENAEDIWVITHNWNSNEFYTYLITPQGLRTIPYIQGIGHFHGSSVYHPIGYMKASPQGDKVALAVSADGIVEVFNFDNNTGILSNPITLNPSLVNSYGLEFSPNGNYLYAGFFDSLYLDNFIYQYNLNITSQIIMNNAAIVVKHIQRTNQRQPAIGAFQLTPDHRIFISMTGGNFLSSIESPNVFGVASNYLDTAITLAGRRAILGLPTFNQSYFRPISIGARNTCIADSAYLFLTDTTGVDSVHWIFGDTAAMGANTSSAFFPQHLYSQGGNYSVQAIYYADTLIDTLTKEIQVVAQPMVSLPKDTALCADSLLIQAQSPDQNYFWSTSSMDSNISVNASGLYWVEVSNACGRIRDSIDVIFDTLVNVQFPASHVLCEGDSLFLTSGPASKATYLWHDSLASNSRFVTDTNGGWNWLQASNTCGVTRDSLWLEIEQVPDIFLGNDSVLCQGDSLWVDATFSRATYLWQDGHSAPRRVLTHSGLYQVNVTNLCGVGFDEILVRFDSLQAPNLPADTLLCIGDSLLLDGSIIGPANYLWHNGLQQASRKVADPGLYHIQATNVCGTLADSILVDSLSIPAISLGADTTFCHGDTLWVDVGYRASSYLWSVANQGPQFGIDTTGLYWALTSNHCGYDVDSIYVVSDLPQTVHLGDDTTIVCGNDSLYLDARSQGTASYLWFNGSTAPTLSVINPGIYWAQASNVCGVSADTILVDRVGYPLVSLPADTMFCEGDSLTLQVFPQSDVTFQWQDGGTNLNYTVKDSGFYWVEARRAVCIRSDSIWVDVDPYPVIELGEDSILCEGDSLLLQVPFQNQVQYTWSDGSNGLSYLVHSPGTYHIDGIRSVCPSRDSIIIQYVDYPLADLGTDTTLCEGDVLTLLLSPQTNVDYTWPDGSSQLSFNISTPGVYTLDARRFHCQVQDSIAVLFDPYPTVNLGADTILCEGADLNLNAFFPGAQYGWSDGSTQPNLLVQEAGIYAVTVSNDCSEASDMISVSYEIPPIVDLGEDTILCEGEILKLDVAFSRASYRWQDGRVEPNFVIDQEGLYSVWVQNLCGEAEDEILVEYQEVPPLSLGQDTTLCLDETLFLDVYAPNSTFLWQDGSTRPGYEVREAGLYHVQLSHRCGIATDSIAVEYQHCECKFFMPNAFSPNGDNVNDKFGPVFGCTYSDYHFQIFNRWGQLLFESGDPSQQWDGTFQGRSVPEGGYVWRLKYQSALEYRGVEKRGSVTVLR